jgi:hypothetical protein
MTLYTARIEIYKTDFFQTPVKTAHYLIEAETPEAAGQEAEGWRRCYDHGRASRAVLASLEPASEELRQLVESTRRDR